MPLSYVLVAIGVDEDGYREVLAVEPADGEKKEAYRNLLKGMIERGLHGVRLAVNDDHKSIQAAARSGVHPTARQFVSERR